MSPTFASSLPVVLLVGREEFTPPSSFAGANTTSTVDCVAVGLRDPDLGAAKVQVVPSTETAVVDRLDLDHLGDFHLECEGLLSVRDVHGREYDALGVDAGTRRVAVLGNDPVAPSDVVFVVWSD